MSEGSGSCEPSDLESDREGTPQELWRGSESPVESFDSDGADEDGNWAVEIIGEEVDMLGQLRYEARWKDWTRADGSNVTWNNGYVAPEDIRPWTKAQKKWRAELASKSLDIEIWETTDIVNTPTRLRAQAYEEKLAIRRRNPPLSLTQKMEMLFSEREAAERGETGPTLRATPARREHTERAMSMAESIASSRSSVTFRSGSVSTLSSSTSTAFETTPRSTRHNEGGNASTLPKSRADTHESRVASSGPSRSQPARTPRKLSKRDELQRSWTQAAKRSHAAEIIIVNDVDDEMLPPLTHNFKYLESYYKYANGIPEPDDTERFVSCDCDACTTASICSCQEPSDLVDAKGRKSYAYTPEGLFAFNVPAGGGGEVIECNILCKCDQSTCPNRVAQRPRDIPIEVFKTVDCGWGVRAPVYIQRGKVLGLYTGLLMRRKIAEALEGDNREYIFDLDGREDPDVEAPDDAYSVDSRKYGNWTRFLNHSCSPNICVYLVVFDTVPERNTPYIAFVALDDIPPGAELTFDYNPAAGVAAKKKGKGKGKIAIPEGSRPCMCRTEACRGWM